MAWHRRSYLNSKENIVAGNLDNQVGMKRFNFHNWNGARSVFGLCISHKKCLIGSVELDSRKKKNKHRCATDKPNETKYQIKNNQNELGDWNVIRNCTSFCTNVVMEN